MHMDQTSTSKIKHFHALVLCGGSDALLKL